MHKTHKGKFACSPKGKKIGGMQRKKYAPPSRPLDDKAAQKKLAEETAAMWQRRARDIDADKFDPPQRG